MYGIIEQIERCQCILILLLNLLRCLLKSRQHRAFSAREVFSRVAVFADFSKHLLHDDKLIRHKGEISSKILGAVISLNVQHSPCKAEQVAQNRIILVVHLL